MKVLNYFRGVHAARKRSFDDVQDAQGLRVLLLLLMPAKLKPESPPRIAPRLTKIAVVIVTCLMSPPDIPNMVLLSFA